MKLTGKCGKTGCAKDATYRGRTIHPDAPVERCAEHVGHHNMTQVLVYGQWRGDFFVAQVPCWVDNKRLLWEVMGVKL